MNCKACGKDVGGAVQVRSAEALGPIYWFCGLECLQVWLTQRLSRPPVKTSKLPAARVLN